VVARWLLVALLVASCSGSTTAVTTTTPTPHTPGPLGDTWTRDGGAWHLQNVAGPSARYLASLAFDAARSEYVLFGGETGTGTSGETWTFDGARWTERHPAHTPPPRRNAAMAYDAGRKVVVMYGGLIPDQAEGTEGDDTWTWDGTDWTPVGSARGGPGPREGARMVDTPDGVLLFGGRISNIKYYGDVWSFDGARWKLVATNSPTGPPGRASAEVAWDSGHGILLVFGGVGRNVDGGPGAQGVPLADTWVLTPVDWVAAIPTGPPSIAFGDAVWDESTNRVLMLFGISCPRPSNDSWAWEGNVRWSEVGPVAVPARWGAAMAAGAGGSLLVFGGDDQPGC